MKKSSLSKACVISLLVGSFCVMSVANAKDSKTGFVLDSKQVETNTNELMGGLPIKSESIERPLFSNEAAPEREVLDFQRLGKGDMAMPDMQAGLFDFGDAVWIRRVWNDGEKIHQLETEVDTWKIRYDERIVREINEFKRRRECNKTCRQTPPQDEE